MIHEACSTTVILFLDEGVGKCEVLHMGGGRTRYVPSTLHTSHPELFGLQTYEGGVHCGYPRESKPVEAARAVAARAAIARNFIVLLGERSLE